MTEKMRVCIIPAAGKGVRFRELGKLYPKCLLPYKNKPILSHIIESIHKDFDEIRIVVSDNSDQIKQFIKNGNYNKIKIIKVNKSLPQGPATSMYSALIGNEKSILIILSDTIYNFKFPAFKNNWFSVMKVDDPSRWCMVDRKIKFYDKPKTIPKTKLALSGAYFFSQPSLLKKSYEKVVNKITSKNKDVEFSIVFDQYKKKEKFKLFEHKTNQIIDLGTIEKYLESSNYLKSRSFNILKERDGVLTKQSKTNPEKIIREYLWYVNSPEEVKRYIPKIYNIDLLKSSLRMEKILSPTLRDIYIFLDKSYETWKNIFSNLNNFIVFCKKTEREGNFWKTIINKTRLRSKNEEKFINLLNSQLSKKNLINKTSFFHGDLVNSNIFYDFQKKSIKFVDPRGEFFGHWLYDIAKLYQCFYGKYDYIDTDTYYINNKKTYFYNKGNEQIIRAFEEIIISKLTKSEIKIVIGITASLYLSMIPLHNHSKINQELFWKEYIFFKKKFLNSL